jgi:hypothetical protein
MQEYEYMATLFYQQGASRSAKLPVFFVSIVHNRETHPIFEMV